MIEANESLDLWCDTIKLTSPRALLVVRSSLTMSMIIARYAHYNMLDLTLSSKRPQLLKYDPVIIVPRVHNTMAYNNETMRKSSQC